MASPPSHRATCNLRLLLSAPSHRLGRAPPAPRKVLRRQGPLHMLHAPQLARDADADRSRVRLEPALLSAPSYTCFHPFPSRHCVLDCALTPLSHLRHAQHAVRSGCCASQLTVRVPARVRVVFADGAQVRARTERASGVLLGVFSRPPTSRRRTTSILKEEVLSNTAWSSTRILRTDSLEMFLAMYSSTDWCSSALSTCPSGRACRVL